MSEKLKMTVKNEQRSPFFETEIPAVAQLLECSPRIRMDRGSIPVRDIPKSLKQVVTAPLPTARQQLLRDLGVDLKPVNGFLVSE